MPYYLLSFMLPAIIMIVALAGLNIVPFGDETLLISDGHGLYVNYLSYVGRVVKGLEDITYSFEKSIGGNMMDSWGWFLLNPTFALFALFDVADYPIAYTLISVLNLSACGTAMYILIKDIYGHKISNLIFSTSYAMNGFLVANVFQLNFFTGVFALPLMILGLRKIIQNKNPLIYILSLTYSLLTNFYFGFMLCVASVLFFAINFLVEGKDLRNSKSVAVKYICSSLLAGMLSAVVWLPALLALRGGRLDQTTLGSYSFGENMPLLEIGAKLFTGANSKKQLENGLPNIFVGILPLLLTILFFINKKIEIKKKIKAGLFLGFYLISFYLVALDMLMHGGTVTNWFNFRYSFVFSFYILFIAAYEWQFVVYEPFENLKKSVVILIVSTVIIFSKSYEFVHGGEVLADFALIAVMFLTYWMHRTNPEKNSRRAFETILIILVGVNLFLNYRICTKKILDWGFKNSDYINTVTPVNTLVKKTNSLDSGFYRMEIDEQRSGTQGNDTMLYGYYGVGHGGSDAKNNIRDLLSQLGIRRFDMRTSYTKNVPASTDAFLGLKYIISKEDLTKEKGYVLIAEKDEWHLYRNDNALPMVAIAEQDISNIALDFEDVFDNLNKAWIAVTGQDTTIFTEEEDIVFTTHNMTENRSMTGKEARGMLTKNVANDVQIPDSNSQDLMDQMREDESTVLDSEFQNTMTSDLSSDLSFIEYHWTASKDGHVYCYNRAGLMDGSGSTSSVMNYEGYVNQGEEISGGVPLTSDYVYVPQDMLEDVAGRFKAAYEDIDTLQAMSASVRQKPATIERIRDNHLCGEFTARPGQLLFFTIPYDDGWTLTVDGQQTELKQVMGAMMAAEVEKGTHSYELRFVPPGLKPAICATMVAVLLLLVYIPIDFWLRRREVHIFSSPLDGKRVENADVDDARPTA